MRVQEIWFAPWQAADYAGLKLEAVYELLESGELTGEQREGRWRVRKTVLDAWLDAEVSAEELQKLTSKMSRVSEAEAQKLLEQVRQEA